MQLCEEELWSLALEVRLDRLPELRSAAGRSALDDATPTRIGRGLQALIAPAEALVCLKLVAATSTEREPRKRRLDEADILAILTRQGARFDHARLDDFIDDLPRLTRTRVRGMLDKLLAETVGR